MNHMTILSADTASPAWPCLADIGLSTHEQSARLAGIARQRRQHHPLGRR